MSTQENKEIVRRLVEQGFNQGRRDVFSKLLAPSARRHGLPTRPADSRDGLDRWWESLAYGFPDQQIIITELLAEADRVVSRSVWRGSHHGNYHGVPPTGLQIEVDLISIYRVADGRVQEIWWHVNHLAALEQLGLIQLPLTARGGVSKHVGPGTQHLPGADAPVAMPRYTVIQYRAACHDGD